MYHLEDPRDPFLTGNCAANATFQPKCPTIQNTAFKNKQTETAKKQLPVTTDLVSNDNLTTVLSGLECRSWIWTFTSYMDLCPITLRVKRFLVSDSGFCLWFWFLVSGFWSRVVVSASVCFWSLGLVLVCISGLWFCFLSLFSDLWFLVLVSGSGSVFWYLLLVSGLWFLSVVLFSGSVFCLWFCFLVSDSVF